MIQYETLTLAELDKTVALYEKYLNYGYAVRPFLQKSLSSNGVIAFKSITDTGKITGFAIYKPGIALSYNHPGLVEKIERIANGAPIYTGDALLVVGEARGRGISRRLNELVRTELIKQANEKETDIYVLHELWIHPDGYTPAEHVVETVYSITHDLGVYDRFYADCSKNGLICPICGPKCTCAAKLVLSIVTTEEKNEKNT